MHVSARIGFDRVVPVLSSFAQRTFFFIDRVSSCEYFDLVTIRCQLPSICWLFYDILAFFWDMLHSTNVDIYTRMITHSYKYMYVHPISMNNSERLDRLYFEIHEVG
jgi:hypothetical protein